MPTMRERVADLEARRAQIQEMGGAEKVAKQHARGKMTARERMTAFFDDQSPTPRSAVEAYLAGNLAAFGSSHTCQGH